MNELSRATPFLSISNSNRGGIKPYDKTSKREKQLVNATAEFISLSLQPIRVVDEPSFRNLLSTADPRFDLPHQTHFSNKVIPDLYDAVRGHIEAQLAYTNYCTITTDLWTSSHQHRSYISLTVHFVDSLKFVQASLCLQTREIPKDHTAEAIRQVLSSLFEEWHISSKVFGGPLTMVKTLLMPLIYLAWNIFLVWLIPSSWQVYAIPKVHTAVARCKKLVEHFNKSNK